LSEILMQRNEASGDWHRRARKKTTAAMMNMSSVITVTEAADMARRLRRFVMIRKGIPDHVLESSEILQEFTEKSLLKQAVQKKLRTFLRSKHSKFVSFSFFYMCLTIILTFLMCFSVTKFRYNEYNFVTRTISLYWYFTVVVPTHNTTVGAKSWQHNVKFNKSYHLAFLCLTKSVSL
jgi:hypothetical protein